MIGYIYKCTCNINNKVYIGQTIQNYKSRWKDHLRHSKLKNDPLYNCKFYKAIRKYGSDAFVWEVIEKIDCEKFEDLQQKLDLLESKYIETFNSYKLGYNSTLGGEHSWVVPKEVCVYSDSGELINVFSNCREVANYYKIPKGVVWSCCGRFTYYTIVNNIRLVFRWKNDSFTKEDKEILENLHYGVGVNLFDINGTFIKTFKSIKDAAIEFNLKNTRITSNCNRKTAFVLIKGNRYFFRYLNDYVTEKDISLAVSIKSDPKVKVVAIDSVTNEILGEFDTQMEAGRKLNTSGHNISEVIRGNRKSAGKYNGHPIFWKKIV